MQAAIRRDEGVDATRRTMIRAVTRASRLVVLLAVVVASLVVEKDEQVAEAVGVSTVRYKLLAFAMGGAVGSLGGALFAIQVGSLNDASFTILVSITALAVVILGGMGSIPGVVVGALVLIGIPGVLSEFEQYRLLLYGAVLMAIMILRPQGLIPNVRRSRELEEEERAQDKWAEEVSADELAAPPVTPLGEGAG